MDSIDGPVALPFTCWDRLASYIDKTQYELLLNYTRRTAAIFAARLGGILVAEAVAGIGRRGRLTGYWVGGAENTVLVSSLLVASMLDVE